MRALPHSPGMEEKAGLRLSGPLPTRLRYDSRHLLEEQELPSGAVHKSGALRLREGTVDSIIDCSGVYEELLESFPNMHQ